MVTEAWLLFMLCRGPTPVSCSELRVQVGMLKLTGLSQLLLLAAAAVEARPALAAAQVSGGGAASEAGTAPAPGDKPATNSSMSPAGKVMQGVAVMPEKVS